MSIEIKDLPMLEEMTPEQLKEMFGAGKFRPEIESLEDRFVMSTAGISSSFSSWSDASLFQTATTVASPTIQVVTTPVQQSTMQVNGTAAVVQQPISAADLTSIVDLQPRLTVADLTQQAAILPETSGFVDMKIAQPQDPVFQNTDKLGQIVIGPSYMDQIGTSFLKGDWQQQGITAIANKVAELGSELGKPLPGFEESRIAPDGYGRYQVFDGKSIYWSPASAKFDMDRGVGESIAGAHVISGAIRDRYFNMGATQFGYPIIDQANLQGRVSANFGATFADFYNPDTKTISTIVHTAETGANIVAGGIRQNWIARGAGVYGVPRGDEYAVTGGRAQDFRYNPGNNERAVVTMSWSAQTGRAHDVVDVWDTSGNLISGVRDKWIRLGREKGIGFPTVDQYQIDKYADSAGGISYGTGLGKIVHFTKSVRAINDDGSDRWIVTSSAITDLSALTFRRDGRSVYTHGAIYHAWVKLGAEKFGTPYTDELDSSDGHQRVTYFILPVSPVSSIKKAIYWHKSGGDITVVVELPNGEVYQQSSQALTAGSNTFERSLLKASPAFQNTDSTDWLSASSTKTDYIGQQLGGKPLWAESMDYASLFGEVMEHADINTVEYIPTSRDADYPLWRLGSNFSEADLASVYESAFDGDATVFQPTKAQIGNYSSSIGEMMEHADANSLISLQPGLADADLNSQQTGLGPKGYYAVTRDDAIIYDDGVRRPEGRNWMEVLADIQLPDTDEAQFAKGFHVIGTEGRDEVRVWESNGWIGVSIFSQGVLYGDTKYGKAEDVPHIFIHGLGGDDLIRAETTTPVYVWGGAGNDTIFGGNSSEGLFINGGEGNDVLEVGPLGSGEIHGGGGDDVIRGGRLTDRIYGGSGNDTIYGNDGRDWLYGQEGHDVIYGGDGHDFLYGDVGNDTLYGGAGDDILIGGPEFSPEYFDNDWLDGGSGRDWLRGGDGSDWLDGGWDGVRDVLQGQRGPDAFVTYGAGPEDNNLDLAYSEGDRISYGIPASIVSKPTAASLATMSSAYSNSYSLTVASTQTMGAFDLSSPLSYASPFTQYAEHATTNAVEYIPTPLDTDFPLWWASEAFNADLAPENHIPFKPDIGLWPEYLPGPKVPPVLDSGGSSFPAVDQFILEALQARLVELDTALTQNEQELKAALDAQAQYQTESERIAADIQAATDAKSAAEQNLADPTMTLAAQMVRDLGLYSTGEEYYDYNGAREKWLMGDAGWYFVLPDGGLYQWDGQNSASGAFVATLDSSYHEDLSKLTDAIETERLQAETQAAELVVKQAAQRLAELQASQLEMNVALEANQRQIANLQSQVNLYTEYRGEIASLWTAATTGVDYRSEVSAIAGIEIDPSLSISPYATLPKLDSNSGARITLFLDFLGGPVTRDFWYTRQNTATKPDQILEQNKPVNLRGYDIARFDLDGNTKAFSPTEQAVIKEIWQRVAEDFVPFNVNVATHWSGALDDPTMMRIAIGGRSVFAAGGADDYGLSRLGSFTTGESNVAFVFSDSLMGLPGNLATKIANVASREAGHAFGLDYHDNSLDYHPANKIMGTFIDREVTRWSQGAVTKRDSWVWQEDLKTLAGVLGLREDDHSQDPLWSVNLGKVGAGFSELLQGHGYIGMPMEIREAGSTAPPAGDVDGFVFHAAGGKVRIDAKGIGAGQNLDLRLELWSGDRLLATSNSYDNSLNASITANLDAGQYYVKVTGVAHQYADFGEYTLTVTSMPLWVGDRWNADFSWSAANADNSSSNMLQSAFLDFAESEGIAAEIQAASDDWSVAPDPFLGLAAELNRDLGLYSTGEEYYNSNGVEEKWLMGDRGWYFMLPDGGLYEWDGQNSATGTLVATLDPSYHEDLTRLTEADARLQQVAGEMDLQTPQDPLEQGVIDNTRLQSAIQTAVTVLAEADQDLAGKNDALAQAEDALGRAETDARESAEAFQNESSQLQAAQDRVTAANTAYQKARKAMNSASGKKRVQLQKKVTAAMVKLNAARAAFEVQSAAAREAESAMNIANEAVENATDARDQARSEMDRAVEARALAAQNLDTLSMQQSFDRQNEYLAANVE